MVVRYRKLINDVRDTFWFIPALMVVAGVVAAFALVQLDNAFDASRSLTEDAWLYRGGPDGARAVLSTIASSTIAVAGTVFSITIAALSLASAQMGPRLLHNFTRDRGNQITLGAFIGTFIYALMVLRTVRTSSEGPFVPHLALTLAIVLAFVCVATLVWFVAHMAHRINVDTVIDLVSADIEAAIKCDTTDPEFSAPPPESYWQDAQPIVDRRSGYLQQLDEGGLSAWAADNGCSFRLVVRPGDYLSPNMPVAFVKPATPGAANAIYRATVLGPKRRGNDLDFSVTQLVEVAVRALSSGINDPHTAITVLDRMGSALCRLAGEKLSDGVTMLDGRAVLVVPAMQYDGLVDAMLQTIRQSAQGRPSVLGKIFNMLATVASCERNPLRIAVLERHADRTLADAERTIGSASDLDEVRHQHERFRAVVAGGPIALLRPA